jgi:hypothetical protein
VNELSALILPTSLPLLYPQSIGIAAAPKFNKPVVKPTASTATATKAKKETEDHSVGSSRVSSLRDEDLEGLDWDEDLDDI